MSSHRGQTPPIGRFEPGRIGSIAAFCLAIMAFSLQTFGAEGSPTDADASDYVLGHGDLIRISVFGHEDLSGDFLLSETDSVSLPLLGELDFSGVTLSDARRIVVDALKPDYLLNPRVSVEVLEYRPFYIIGEVNNPGAYPYVSGMTAVEAVALGGGFTYRARRERVLVIRATDETGVEHTISIGDKVFPGDVVKVPERLF